MTTLDPSLTDPDSYGRTRIEQSPADDWPRDPTIVRHVLEGDLADRVRRRFEADERDEVRLIQTTSYSGYEYTREQSTEFTIECFGGSETFIPESSHADWRDDVGETWADSVFARFDAWLAVAERPVHLFHEWFEFEDEGGDMVRYRSRPDTILTRTAARRRFGIEHLSLTGIESWHGEGRSWRLDLVAAPDDTGFQKICERFREFHAPGTTVSEPAMLAILKGVTDLILPGSSRR